MWILLWFFCHSSMQPAPADWVPNEHPGFTRQSGTLFYLGQPFTGHRGKHHDNGRPALLETYRDGLRHGWLLKWYADGPMAEQRFYLAGRKEGTHLGWWPDGTLRFRLSLKAGLYHGSQEHRYRGGGLAALNHYENGREVGIQKAWTERGELFANYVARDGRRYGLIGAKPCYTTSIRKSSSDPEPHTETDSDTEGGR